MSKIPVPPASFAAPWHGQAFALAVSLNQAGLFSWPEWTEVFAANLARMRQEKELDGSDDYYIAWVSALEQILVEKDVLRPDMLAEMKTLWSEAFLSTPHGKPVRVAGLKGA